jgi:hypothetical protein
VAGEPTESGRATSGLHLEPDDDERRCAETCGFQNRSPLHNAAPSATAIRVARMKPYFADPSARFLLPAGPGVFVCSAHIRSDVSMDGGLQAHIRARTWLHRDQLSDNQESEIFIVDNIAGERLGEGYLLPMPLRVIEAVHAGPQTGMARVAVWAPGMPETIAQPIGTA